MSDLTNKDSLGTAQVVSNTLLSLGLENWLFRGTLLGATRNNSLLPNATRLHFCYLATDTPNSRGKESKIERWFGQVAGDFGLSLETLLVDTSAVESVAGYKLSGGPLEVEFHACNKIGSDVFLVSNPRLKYKYYYVDELGYVDVCGWAFPCPRYTEKLCALLYGNGWDIEVSRDDYYRAAFDNGTLHCLGKAEVELTGYTEGVFDLFHIGHLNLLKRGKALFDRVLVGVETDAGSAYKRSPTIPYEQRAAIVEACKYVDGIVDLPIIVDYSGISERKRTLAFYEKHNIDYEFAGRSADTFFLNYYSDVIDHGRLHLISRTDAVSTTDIIENIRRKKEVT